MPPSERRAPPVRLITPDPSARLRVSIDHLADDEQERITAALPFVGGLRIEFSREWPAAGVDQGRPGHFTRTYPWAECWPLHGALVTEFSLLRAWTEVLESGEVALTAYGGEFDRWSRHIQDVTVPMMRRIGQLCALSGTTVHVDPAVPRPGSGAARSHRWGRPVHGAHAIHHEMGGHAAARKRQVEE